MPPVRTNGIELISIDEVMTVFCCKKFICVMNALSTGSNTDLSSGSCAGLSSSSCIKTTFHDILLVN